MAQPQQADVQSPRAIIEALYQVISGEAGAPRNWERFLHLFAPDARLIPTSKAPDSSFTYRTLSPQEYVTLFSSRMSTGFFEQELHNITESYGTIVHVWSTYATQTTKGGPNTNRGINSIQLLYNGQRYYIMSIYWCAESMGFALPGKYLP